MRSVIIRSGFVVFALNAAFGQAQTKSPKVEKKLEFEVASIRPALQPPPQGTPRGPAGGPGTGDPSRFTCSYCTLQGLLVWAYQLEIDQIAGPSWWATEYYDIMANVPEGTTKQQFQAMFQNLLADRFKMTVHFEKRDFTAYVMTVAKGGLKMKEFVNDPKAPPPAFEPDGRPARYPLTFKDGFPVLAPGNTPGSWAIDVNGRRLLTARRRGTDEIVSTFQQALGPGVRVVDKTGLTGKYDYHLQYARLNNTAAGAQDLPPGSDFLDSIGEPAPDVITAVQQQLGLMLTKGKVAVDVLVIDRVEKTPAAN